MKNFYKSPWFWIAALLVLAAVLYWRKNRGKTEDKPVQVALEPAPNGSTTVTPVTPLTPGTVLSTQPGTIAVSTLPANTGALLPQQLPTIQASTGPLTTQSVVTKLTPELVNLAFNGTIANHWLAPVSNDFFAFKR